jgi:hypothetical protein
VDVADAIRSLAALGVSVQMITGDNKPVTQHSPPGWIAGQRAQHTAGDGRHPADRAVRVQALTPIPSAPTLETINQALLARMDARPRPRDLVSCSGSRRCSSPSSSPPGIGLALTVRIGVIVGGWTSGAVPAQQQIDIVLNWFEELKTKVPTK